MPRARPLCASMSVGLKIRSSRDAENLFVSGRGAGFYELKLQKAHAFRHPFGRIGAKSKVSNIGWCPRRTIARSSPQRNSEQSPGGMGKPRNMQGTPRCLSSDAN